MTSLSSSVWMRKKEHLKGYEVLLENKHYLKKLRKVNTEKQTG